MRIVTLTLSLLVAAPAAAKPPRAKNSVEDADAAARRGKTDGGLTIYVYDDDRLSGDVLTPDGRLIQWRAPTHHPSLVRVRDNFVAELIRLASDV
jgi:hypothetical protein